MNRRNFLANAAGSLGATAWTARSYSQIAGANGRVRLGLIGCGGRGRDVAKIMQRVADAQYVALCDAYTVNAGRAKDAPWSDDSAEVCQDFRHVLDRNDIDAVHIATPDHWHAIPGVLACQAGKDAYVEKPLTHNIREGRALVAAARANNRIIQTGTQHRSAPHFAEAATMIAEGKLGDVRFVRVWNYRNLTRPTFAFMLKELTAGLDQQPDALDWDLYCGPAPLVPYERTRFLNTYRGYYEYAGGFVSDYGAHRFDSMRQMMGEPDPVSVSATGGRYIDRPGNTPDVVQATVEFPTFTMSYEGVQTSGHGVGGRTPDAKYYRMNGQHDRPHGVAIYGTKGVIIADRIGLEVYPETNTAAPRSAAKAAEREAYKQAGITKYVPGAPERRFEQSRDTTDAHCANFIDCVRSRQKPSADVETGHRSSIIPHLINIAYRTGEKIKWDPATETIAGAPAATALLTREAREPWDIVEGT